jgi:hypothetical protein
MLTTSRRSALVRLPRTLPARHHCFIMPRVTVTFTSDEELLDFLGDRQVWFGAPMTAHAHDTTRMRACFERLEHKDSWLIFKWKAGVDPTTIMHDPLGQLCDSWTRDCPTTFVVRTHGSNGEAFDCVEITGSLGEGAFANGLPSAEEYERRVLAEAEFARSLMAAFSRQ